MMPNAKGLMPSAKYTALPPLPSRARDHSSLHKPVNWLNPSFYILVSFGR